MRRRPLRIGTRAAALALLAAGALPSLRLIHPGTGAPLFWATPQGVSVVIHDQGSDDLGAGEHLPALRGAIDAWNDVDGSAVRLVENTDPTAMAIGDWASPAHHVLRFDETNESGYFPFGSSTVAITPVWFLGDGRITDADVLFNGRGYGFTTKGEPGRFDVQDVATHELGHLLGLDHSGLAGATLYPYVDPSVILHRSLSHDERQALRAIYPAQAHSALTGSVVRASDASGVPGAQVVARDASGRTRGGALTDGSGNFTLAGLGAGDYRLVALPLDAPVSAHNISAGHPVETDFEPAEIGPIAVGSAQSVAAGPIAVGADVALNLGTAGDRLPLRATSGETTTHELTGSGLHLGAALEAGDPDVGVQVLSWGFSSVTFRLVVPPGEEPGHFDLAVTDSSGRRSVLPAAAEVTPPDPVVSAVSPAQQSTAGGVPVTIFGAGFRPGCRVVIAGAVYEEGAPGGCTLEDSGTLTLTTRASAAGTWDVVVIDATGVEGRLASAIQLTTVPQVASVFPSVGDDGGETFVTIKGSEFVEGATVTIDGAVQHTIALLDSSTIVLETESGTAGGPYELRVTNPGGASAAANFAYVVDPDPAVIEVDPGGGGAGGGEDVLVRGANFTADTLVVFGADPETGLGGTPARGVTVLGPNELVATTPGFAVNGRYSVLARANATGQAAVVAAAFEVGGAGGEGGGGGCASVAVPGPPATGDVLRALGFYVLLALGARSLRPRRHAVPVAV